MIKIEDLGFSYGSLSVLDHISMTLEDGRIHGLLGENGVGKTTLLTLLAGLKSLARAASTPTALRPMTANLLSCMTNTTCRMKSVPSLTRQSVSPASGACSGPTSAWKDSLRS